MNHRNMLLEGDGSVIKALKQKKYLLDSGKPHDHIKPLLIIDGGLMKGAYGVGAGLAFADLGFDTLWDNVVGISSGAPTVAYLLSGNAEAGASVMYEECCSTEFANFRKFSESINFQYFIDVIKNDSKKKLNVEKVLNNKTKIFLGVTDFYTAEPNLIEPVDEEGLFLAIEASISMPNVSLRSILINGKRYTDGGFDRPHIISKAITDIEATHILLITNQDKEGPRISWRERFLNDTLFRFRMSHALRIAANSRRYSRLHVLDALRKNKSIKMSLVWGDGSIGSLEQKSEVVRSVIEKSRQWWHNQLA